LSHFIYRFSGGKAGEEVINLENRIALAAKCQSKLCLFVLRISTSLVAYENKFSPTRLCEFLLVCHYLCKRNFENIDFKYGIG
jgi:hypothetical protein